MIQEDKNLLLQDLCSRLLYGVRCSFGVDDAIYEITGINPSSCGASEIQATHVKSGINGDFIISSCKPYLFPLSSMTLDQMEDFANLLIEKYKDKPEDSVETIGLVRDNENREVLFKMRNKTTGETFLSGSVSSDNINNIPLKYSLDWFLKNHFDWRGLIPLGLAKDATGLNIY